MAKKVKSIDTRAMPVTKEAWHGTMDGYTNHKCRCERCKRRWAKYTTAYRTEKFGGGKAKCKAVRRSKATGEITWRCDRNAWAGAGNGLCRVHHKAKMAREGEAKERVTA